MQRALLSLPLLPDLLAAGPETMAIRAAAIRAAAIRAAGAEEGIRHAVLAERARRLAAALRAAGVVPDDRVGVFLERSPALVVALAAVLEAGGAFVPLDPSYPPARLAFMAADARPRAIVTDRRLAPRLPATAATVIVVDAGGVTGDGAPARRRRSALDGGHAAYVLYTSGSSGRPKGVVVPHAALAHHMRWMAAALPLRPDDRVLQKTSASFDASLWEIWAPLLAGAELVLAPPGLERDPAALAETVRAEAITVLQVVPTLLAALLDEDAFARCTALRRLCCGGELLPAALAERFFALHPGAELVNLYGPTEATIEATWAVRRAGAAAGGASVAIGRPITGVRAHLVDAGLRPAGADGELLLAGPTLARGYLGRPALTAARFVPDPFATAAGGRAYRTGDRARRLPGGELECRGRLDHQVKVRGVRLELGEVEAVLRAAPAVRDAVAAVREDTPGERRLVAYVVPAYVVPAATATSEEAVVAEWGEVYDSVYRPESARRGADVPVDATFDTAGWTSSFTGEPLPEDEVRAWLAATVERLRELSPRRVFEIGCGTGLILHRLAPRCERYLGTDLSPAAAAALAAATAELPRVEVAARPAHDFTGIEPGAFDLVLVNSVTQHFPSVDYLLRVIDGMVRAAAPGGAVFVGDVRALPLLDAFHAAVELHRGGDVPLAELRRRIAERRRREEMLVVDPALFPLLGARLPRVSEVRVRPKTGRQRNELTPFRFDVVLHLDGPPPPSIPAAAWIDGRAARLDGDGLRRLLAGRPPVLGIAGVADPRLARERELLRLLAAPGGAATARELRRRLAAVPAAGVEPADWPALLAGTPYRHELSWARTGADGAYDVLLWRRGRRPAAPGPARPRDAYANDPLRARAARDLVPALRARLAARLPEAMVPSALVVLEALPTGPGGKVDRAALPPPATVRPRLATPFAAPRGPLEEELAAIWREVLRLDRVGVDDDFFALGGHSLLATQVVSRIRARWGVELPLARLFDGPTIAALAAAVEELLAAGTGAGPPIVPVDRGGELPLSFAQQRLWLQSQLDPASPEYVVLDLFRLRGELDAAALERTFQEIVDRHEVFRTTFPSRGGRPRQHVAPALAVRLPRVDLGRLAPAARAAEVARLAHREERRPFDLARGPLLRLALLALAADEHVLVLATDHMLTDDWSQGVLYRELVALYSAFVRRRPSPLPPLAVHYADFAAWQRAWLSGDELARQLGYWRRRLAGVPALELPTDRPRPRRRTYRGRSRAFALPAPLTAALEELAGGRGASLYMALLAGFMALLGRLTGQDDVVVGSPIANRHRREVEDLIGFFVNMLVMRGDLAGEPSFGELLAQTRAGALAAYAHQDLPFEKLVEELNPRRDLARQPLFQVALALQTSPRSPVVLPGLEWQPLALEQRVVRFDLELFLWRQGESLRGLAVWNVDLFDATTVHRWLGAWRRLLAAAAAAPGRRLGELELLAAGQQHQLVTEWNDARGEYPRDATLHELFARQAARTPDAVALDFADGRLTYGELARRAARLAARLRAPGLEPEGRVAVVAEPSAALVVGVLGVLAAGGVYVPCDPAHPRARLAEMVSETGAAAVVAGPGLGARLPGLPAVELAAVELALAGAAAGVAAPPARAAATSLACVLFTSGSTGRPKGVGVTHRAVARLVCASNYLRIAPGERVAQTSSVAFDAATFEIWGALLHGACLVGFERPTLLAPRALAAAVRRRRIDVLFFTTALFQQTLDAVPHAFAGVGHVLFGGEAVDPERVRPLFAAGPPRRLLHLYGPAESTTFATWQRVAEVAPGAATIAVGMPVAQTTAYLLDARLRPAALGVMGELCLGGDGLARGYEGRAAASAARFVPDPFAGAPGRRLYRTGDRARRRADGRCELHGRFDRQVKIRGNRVEPGEIEARLRRHPRVADAAVAVAGDGGGERRLAAFVVGRGGAAPAAAELRRYLERRLPRFMVPAAFVELAALPLRETGKLDRRRLAAAAVDAAPAADAAPPADAVEALVAAIFAEVLGRGPVGADDDFFALGGHSLNAVRIVARLRELSGRELPLAALFERPTVAELAAALRGAPERGAPAPVTAVAREGELPLSFAQERLWFLDQLTPASPAYNVPEAWRLDGPLDAAALGAAWSALVDRHESLRTSFPSAGGRPRQAIAPAGGRWLPLVDLGGLAGADAAARRLAETFAAWPFDLARGPLARAVLARLGRGEHRLLLDVHHTVTDGWSQGIVRRELGALYEAARHAGRPPLPPLPIQAADVAAWQRRTLTDETLAPQLAYWRRQLAAAPPLVELPADRPRPPRAGWHGAWHGAAWPLRLAPAAADALRRLAAGAGASLFMTLLAGVAAALHRFTGQGDLVVGTPVARRPEAARGLVGLFVDHLVLRHRVDGGARFADLLAAVRETTLLAFAHGDVPFERLVRELAPERATDRHPLFQVTFALHNVPAAALALPGLEVTPEPLAFRAAIVDLDLALAEVGGALAGEAIYRTDLFDATTIGRLARGLAAFLAAAAAAPRRPLGELPLLAAAARHQVLWEWNDRAAAFPPGTVAELFAEQAARAPDAVAIAAADAAAVSYGELDRATRRLACRLRALGVGPESVVGLGAERSVAFTAAVVAVARAGAAWLPLDPALPAARRAAMAADAGAAPILDERGVAALLAGGAAAPEPPPPAAGNAAYVLYTSGSGGRPRGVVVSHGALAHHMRWLQRELPLEPGDRLLQKTPAGFDAAVWEIWGPLLAGARLVLAAPGAHREPARLAASVGERRITVLQVVPTLLRALVDEPATTLRRLACGGEALSAELRARAAAWAPAAELVNLYGPTETTIHASWASLGAADVPGARVPIGRPIANARVHLLDAGLRPVPAGVAAELCVAGRGLARGYLGRPARTAERFLADPFARAPGERLYRTGDRARHRADGALEFLGRLDRQVKIRGVRVEPGEIEALLVRHPAVAAAAVVDVPGDAGERGLVAYVSGRGNGGIDAEALRDHLRRRLPEAVIPAAFAVLDALPVNASGKVDHRALRRRAPAPAAGPGSRAPRTPHEAMLAEIWQRILGVEAVGVDDNFFALGGHSLLAARVAAAVRRAFGVELPLRALFEAPTVARLAPRLAAPAAAALPAVAAAARSAEPPLSFAQQRLWFLDRLDPGSTAYLMTSAWRLAGTLDAAVLGRALGEIARRHEVLRTVFPSRGGRAWQRILPPAAPALPLVDLGALAAGRRQGELRRLRAATAARPFDLAAAPPWRALLLRLGAREHALFLDFHHAVFDGASEGLLLGELGVLYEAFAAGRPSPLPELPLQYADYAQWQRRQAFAGQLDFWRRRLAGLAPPGFFGDRPRPATAAGRGALRELALPPGLAGALGRYAVDSGVSLYMVLLAGFLILLHRHTGEPDVAVGSPAANRGPGGTEDLLGLFVNMLVMRGDLAGDPPLPRLLERVRETALAAYAHQDVPFEQVVEALRPARDPARHPLFQVTLGIQEPPRAVALAAGLRLAALELPPEPRLASRFDLELFLWRQGGDVRGFFVHDAELFHATTIARMAGHLTVLLAAMAAHPHRRVGELPLLSAGERHQLCRESGGPADPRPAAGVYEEIAARAAAAPDAVAAAGGGETLTYGELARRAERLAGRLRALGVGPEVRVAVVGERSPAAVVGLLGVLAAGGAYVPLEPADPEAHRRRLLADSGAVAVVRGGRVDRLAAGVPAAGVPAAGVPAADVPAAGVPAAGVPAAGVPAAGRACSRNLAYVVYTSGSTGRPKGVLVTRAALANHTRSAARAYGLGPGDRVLHFASLAFDASAEEIFSTLASGAALELRRPELPGMGELLDLAERRRLTVLPLPTAYWHELAAFLESTGRQPPTTLRRVVIGGEAARRDRLAAWWRQGGHRLALTNTYGPTEGTIVATRCELAPGAGAPPIGRPIDHVDVRVVDARLRPAPRGAPGELALAGAGLARGYLGRPRRTAAVFVPRAEGGGPGGRLYRTGDRARLLADGRLEFLGRLDDQVKVRGVRVEPGEVEACLRRHPALRDAAVSGRDGGLTAHVVPAAAAPPPGLAGELGAFLRAALPASRVPSAFVVVPELPRTAAGKVDRRALPPPGAARPDLATPHVEPASELERTIAEVWRRALGLESVGVDDNFFDLGGHSLLLAEVQSELGRRLGRDLALVELFRHPTVRRLAAGLGGEAEPERARRRAAPSRGDARVAVIGLSGRFPGASRRGSQSLADFWSALRRGVESITFFSDAELAAAGVAPELRRHPRFVAAAGILAGVELFDAAFFGFSPREAELTDVQQRLFLECSWEALERAGYDPRRFPGAIGVYAASTPANRRHEAAAGHRGAGDLFAAEIGAGPDYLATRVAYQLDLRGPGVNVQTACSSSLVAVHLACQGLASGECELALAGGASILVPQAGGHLHDAGSVLSPDGHCRAFDAAANGTVGGHGVAVVVLKPLAAALADGDPIHAVIRGSAINNDGAGKVGYTAPSVDGQAAVISEALARAGVDAATVGYVEAHGTGTPLGDPVEVAALTRAFAAAARGERAAPCALGSLKTNVGHLDAAAGVAGLVKTVLALEHGEIPPSLHFERPHPELGLAASPFRVPTRPLPWRRQGAPRRAGVSSFGIGGTNAHVVVEEAPERPPSGPARPWHLAVLSARTAAALEAASDQLAAFLEAHPDLDPADVAYTLQVGRAELEHRRAWVGRDLGELARALAGRDPERVRSARARRRPLTFLLPGGGAQHAGMAGELYRVEPGFRREVDRCAELFTAAGGGDPRAVLLAAAADSERPSVALPALFTVEYALARLWLSWGVTPAAMIGHSLGEVVAACLAEVLTPADAAALVTLRGRLFERLPAGSMLALPLPEEEARALLPPALDLAAVNGPADCVAAGPRAAVEGFARALAARGVEARRLHIEVAAHSRQVEPILADFAAGVRALRPSPPRLPYASNVTGRPITAAEATDPEYWVRHLRAPVRFGDALAALGGDSLFLEVGPGRTLATLARRGGAAAALSSLPHPGREGSDSAALLATLGRLWLAGTPVDWAGFSAGQRRARVELPTYPFELRRFPLAASRPAAVAADAAAATYLPAWRRTPPPALLPAAAADDGVWLLFADPGERLGERLAGGGRRLVTVEPGPEFADLGDGRYRLDPGDLGGYRALIDDLDRRGALPGRIVHLWTVAPSPSPAAAHERGFQSLLGLARAWLARAPRRPWRLDVVSSGLFEVVGGEELEPDKATLLGIVRVLPQEHAHLRCRVVDVAPAAAAEPLAAELAAAAPEPEVALRGGHRWASAVEAVSLPAPAAAPLRRGGVYLITGGLGGVGLELADDLARALAARLVLVGRSPFPPPAARAAWLAEHPPDDPTSARIRRLRAWEEAGARVLVASADVTCPQAMAAVLARARRRFGDVHGVVHAAAVAGGGLIDLQTPEKAAACLAPKVAGTRVLAELFARRQQQPLDFFFLCSSLGSLLGGIGSADYTAANAFLDAVAERGLPGATRTVAVAWDAWRATGMVASPGRRALAAFWRLADEAALEPRQGVEIFRRALAAGAPRVIVSLADLGTALAASRALDLGASIASLEEADDEAPAPGSAVGGNGHPRPELDTPFVAPRDEEEDRVAAIWREVLGLERVGVHDDFFELGGHSLLATRILARLRRRHGVELALGDLLAAATVAGLARRVRPAAADVEEAAGAAPLFDRIEEGSL